MKFPCTQTLWTPYTTVMGPTTIYGLITVSLKKSSERKIKLTNMRVLRWMSEVTGKYSIRNEVIRGIVKITSMSKKVMEEQMRREEVSCKRQTMDMQWDRRRRRERPKTRWKDYCSG